MGIGNASLRSLMTFFMLGAGGAAFAAGAGDPMLADAVQHQDKQAVAALLMQGADAKRTQADGTTALHWAVHWNDAGTADALLTAGADVNARNDYGASPLSLACENANAAMVETLLDKGAFVDQPGANGETPLMGCARTGNPAAVKALLAHQANVEAKDNEQGQTALMWAVSQKHPAATQALLEGSADVKAKSKGGFSPIMFAARVGDVESAGILLKAGAGLDEAGPNGMTPLIVASASGQEAMAIFFLEAGADANARDRFGATALHYSLLKGITALDQVRYANYVVHLFRPNMTGLVKALLAHKADPNIRIEKPVLVGGARSEATIGATPFVLAAASPDPAAMRLLVAAGADAKLATADNITAVMAASGLARGQDFTEDDKRLALEAVTYAVELGGDVNATSGSGLTALHGAALNGADGVAQFLIEKGAKLDVRDKYQQTPLSIAAGIRLPWIPYGDELGEIIQPSTRDLLLKLGATPLDTPGYFKPPSEDSEAFRLNQAQRSDPIPGLAPAQK